MSRRPPIFPRHALLCLALGGLCLPLLAHAQNAASHWQMPAGPLAQNLESLARQAGISLAYDLADLQGKSSPALQGSMSVEQALRHLLQGSGLDLQVQDGNQYLILPPSPGSQPLELSQIGISADAQDSNSLYRTPGSVHQIDREALERVPYSSVGDIFKSVPGVVAANNRNGGSLELNIRGLQGSGRVKTLVDGSMQTTSLYRGYSGSRDQTYIDPDLIGRISIEKGPSAGPQGAGAIGGVVNMQTLDSRDILLDGKSYGLRMRGMYGNNVGNSDELCNHYNMYNRSYGALCFDRSSGRKSIANSNGTYGDYYSKGYKLSDSNHSASLAGAWKPLENWEIVAAHSKRSSGNYRAGSRGADSWKGAKASNGFGNAQSLWPADGEVRNTSFESESYLLKTRIRFLEDHSLDLSHIDYKSYSGEVTSISVFGHFVQDQLSWARTSTYTAGYSWKPDSSWFDLRANLWKTDMQNFIAPMGSNSYLDTWGGELWNTSNLNLPLGELTASYGSSFSQEDVSGKTSGSTGSYFSNPAGQREMLGHFTNLKWQATSWLALNAGIRYDRATLESQEQSSSALRKRTFTQASPSYGLTLSPWSSLQVFALWNQGMRAPTLREAYVNDGTTAPNPDLKPERADNFEYGANLALDGLFNDHDKLGIKLVRFDNRYDDYISRQTRAAANAPSGSGYVWSNLDRADFKGTELSLDYDSEHVFASYGLTRYDSIRYCYNGYVNYRLAYACYKRPPANDYGSNYMPARQSEHATLGVRLLQRQLTLGARMNASSQSMNGGSNAGNYMNTLIWEAYEIYDLFGSYKLNQHLELGFSVENLRDRFYMDNLSNNMEALPSPGRTSRLTVTAWF